jgi:hypothetical protein
MSKTKRYAKPIYVMVALALVLSLAMVALPMRSSILADGEVTFFSEDFEGGLPGDWTVVNNGGHCVWRDDDPCGRTPLDGCSGIFMIADSECCGYVGYMDTELWTPSIDCSAYATVTLEFNHYYYVAGIVQGDRADVDISNDAGTTWTTIVAYVTDASGQVGVDISAHAAGESDVRIRWHYYNAYYLWWWEVDNVKLSGTPLPTPAPSPPMVPTVSHSGIVALITLFAGLLVWTVWRRRLAC